MSAVTASIIVGTRHRSDPGIQPRWLLLLHEGQSYAWHLLKLQLTNGDLPSTRPEDPPGVLWQASRDRDLVGEMALLVHLFAARTPEIVRLAARTPALRKQRVDLAALDPLEREQVAALLELARERGRELTLAATILPGSRLTQEALLGLSDWELNVSHTGLTRSWDSVAGRLVVTDVEAERRAAADASWEDGWTDSETEQHPLADADLPELPGDTARRADGRSDADSLQEVAAQGLAAQDVAESVPRGRFLRRRHRAPIDTGARHLTLAEFFGRKD